MIYALIPILFLFMLFNLCNNKIKSFIYALTIWASVLYLVTELLSFFNLINRTSLLVFWLVFNLILYLVGRKRKCKLNLSFLLDKYKIAILIVFGILLVGDYIVVPYNWDSMTYHLPRIMFWAQNSSVAHFPTYDSRMLTSPVLAEFVNLHNYVLIGSDKLFNFVQGFSFIGIVFLIASICKVLNLDKKVTYLACFLFMSMPIAMAESLTTQVDLFSTVWALAFVCLSLDLMNKDKIVVRDEIFNLITLGLIMGLGYLSKPSVCLMMLVFGIALLIVRIKHKDGINVYLLCPIIIGVVALFIVSFEIVRNLNTFGAISDPIAGERQLVGTLAPNYLIINFLKNFLFQLGLPFIYQSYGITYMFIAFIGSLIGVDINDPLIAEDGMVYSIPAATDIICDTAIATLVCALLIIVLALCVIRKKKLDLFDKASLISFVAFLFILRWERYESRYVLTYLALLCVFVSKKLYEVNINVIFERVIYLGIILSICWFVVYFPRLYSEPSIFKRPDGYFASNIEIKDEWLNLSEYINGQDIKTVTIKSNDNYYTYPIFALCNLEHVECYSDGVSSDYVPDAIVYLGTCDDEIDYHNHTYKVTYVSNEYHVLIRD